MSDTDDKHEAEKIVGKGEEAIGDATDNGSLEASGKADQAKANLKQAGDHVKDALTDDDKDDRSDL